jgi:transcriptional regulator PpsR
MSGSKESRFRALKRTLGDLDFETFAQLIAAVADVALVLDADGIIRDVALGSEQLSKENWSEWIGRRWLDTVTDESQSEINKLLNDASKKAQLRWRQVNHPTKKGTDVSVNYAAIRASSGGMIVAVGRDLRTELQRRLVDMQQSVERENSRLRQAETRYRLLFHMAAQPVLTVDANCLLVVDANPAAAALLKRSPKRISGRAFLEFFDTDGRKAVQALLMQVKETGRADEIIVFMNEGKHEAMVGASLFRNDKASHFLVQLVPMHPGLAQPPRLKFFRVIESLPDGFVVTDLDQRIRVANPAFLDFAELASEAQARGQKLDRWLGRPGIDFDALIANLREHGSIRHFNTILRGEHGANEEVVISAVALPSGEYPCYGFTIRGTGVQQTSKPRRARELPRSVEQLTQLVGRMTLRELVRETTDVIERLCIEAALELTGDNRASAADMLGLSRQSLYSKLRRLGLGNLDGNSSSSADSH